MLHDNPEVAELLAAYEPGHSHYQRERFSVTLGNWTPWGRYKQALCMLKRARRDGRALRLELQLLDLQLVELDRRWCFRNTTRERRRIERTQLLARHAELLEALHTIEQDAAVFAKVARELAVQHEFDALTPLDRQRAEAEHWREKARFDAAVDVATMGTVSRPTLELISALPAIDRRRILNEVSETVRAIRSGATSPTLLEVIDNYDGGGIVAGELEADITVPHNPRPAFPL